MPAVREARPDDVDAIEAIHAASVRGLAASRYDAVQIESWSDGADYSLPTEGVHVVVAEEEGPDAGDGIVGFGAVDLDSGEIRAAYVHPDHAGEGVGSAVLGALETAASEAGLTDLQLTASLNAVAFYERHGWEPTGRTTHELDGGVELEAMAMEKSIR